MFDEKDITFLQYFLNMNAINAWETSNLGDFRTDYNFTKYDININSHICCFRFRNWMVWEHIFEDIPLKEKNEAVLNLEDRTIFRMVLGH